MLFTRTNTSNIPLKLVTFPVFSFRTRSQNECNFLRSFILQDTRILASLCSLFSSVFARLYILYRGASFSRWDFRSRIGSQSEWDLSVDKSSLYILISPFSSFDKELFEPRKFSNRKFPLFFNLWKFFLHLWFSETVDIYIDFIYI